MGLRTQETLTKLTWATWDPLVVKMAGSAIVKFSSIFSIYFPVDDFIVFDVFKCFQAQSSVGVGDDLA